VPNVRARGKIPKSEWPKIGARFRGGETLTEIARSYGCTAPAIRYIVRRASASTAKKTEGGKLEKVAVLAPPAPVRRAQRPDGLSDRAPGRRGATGLPVDSLTRDIWDRVNTDVAQFLAAMDSLLSDDSAANYEALLEATDRLLWASARTRLELERILNRKKQSNIRRISA
jgi:hypothetical protein